MRIIGLTGPSGAGKSTLCERFEELGIPCVNTDNIYHALTNYPSSCLEELKEEFGEQIININGALDRKALAKLVFEGEDSKKNLALLNNITHKYVWDKTNEILTKHMDDGKKVAVIDAPALFSSSIFIGACDFIVSVLCDKEVRIKRIMARDKISRDKALARVNAQPDDSLFEKHSDYCIYNDGDKEHMNEQLASIFEQEEIFIK